MLILESDELEAPELELEAGISVVHLTEGDALVMAGEDHIFMQVLERDFRVSAGSFFQVNTVMAEKMVEHLLDKLPLPAKTILDVYCGVGLFSAFLAPKCERLIGIESSPSACEDFAVNLDEFDHVELYEGAAEDVIPHLEAEQPIVLVDPPRSGVDKRALDGIRQLSAESHRLRFLRSIHIGARCSQTDCRGLSPGRSHTVRSFPANLSYRKYRHFRDIKNVPPS